MKMSFMTEMNATEMQVIGIDIGGSHISAGIVDLNGAPMQEHAFLRAKVRPDGTAGEIIDAWAIAIETCFYAAQRTPVQPASSQPGSPRAHWRIGIAMPGPFDYDRGISLITG